MSDEKLVLFHREYVTSKEDLLELIENELLGHLKKSNIKNRERKEALYQEFYTKVMNTPLFDKLEDWWLYSFSINTREIVLYLNHVGYSEIEDREDGSQTLHVELDVSFSLVRIAAPVMTADEYATKMGVANSTIRVWIRRGKIRSAYKLGNTWMIPEFARMAKRGYSSARYRLVSSLSDVPVALQKFKLNLGGEVQLTQHADKHGFDVIRYDTDNDSIYEIVVDNTEIEKLEAYLIANPNVIYTGDERIYCRRHVDE